MNKINLLMVLLGCFILAGSAFARDNSSEFVGTWAGDFCTMDAKDGLHCGKPADIVIDEQKEDLIRGHITVNGKQYPLSGIINGKNTIDYTDALGSIGTLRLMRENIMQMRTLNRCVKGETECAHKGIFKKKK
jgi:hypothetical protein